MFVRCYVDVDVGGFLDIYLSIYLLTYLFGHAYVYCSLLRRIHLGRMVVAKNMIYRWHQMRHQ